jgi:hypothetical protein
MKPANHSDTRIPDDCCFINAVYQQYSDREGKVTKLLKRPLRPESAVSMLANCAPGFMPLEMTPARVIDSAGRQRMLSQQLSMMCCADPGNRSIRNEMTRIQWIPLCIACRRDRDPQPVFPVSRLRYWCRWQFIGGSRMPCWRVLEVPVT